MSQVLDTWSPKESVRDPSVNGCALNAENRNTNRKTVKGRLTARNEKRQRNPETQWGKEASKKNSEEAGTARAHKK
jgi:hypothetical protein